jgi:GT2 family glycosyltransferase
MSEHPDVSVLIVNWNTRTAVLACLDSLPVGVDDDLHVQTVVVDNGSVDGSADALATRSEITLIRNDDNLGFAVAVNQAYREASGEFVLLLNSDVELTRGTLSTLTRFLKAHPDAAGVAPLYLNPDGSEQPFHFRFPTFATTLANGSKLIRRIIPGSERRLREYRMTDEDFSQPRVVPQPSASCLLLRRSVLAPDYLLDERYPIFGNDVKLARTLAARGLKLWVIPEASVIHEAHSSARRLGYGPGRRQYLASTVRLLAETESPLKVWLYRSVVFSQNVALRIAGRPSALGGRDLLRALAGDPGELPSRPRD